ncbi:MAG: sporulation protein YqfD [Clostridiales bacterium]|nr:sporulation protein YqfD [Clostridiales bacterium]
MYKNITNFLQGTVCVRVESPCPERVLNLCSARAIAFWDLRWESGTVLSFKTTRRDWRRLQKGCDNLNATLKRQRETGVPGFLARFRRRYALLIGLGLCVLLLFGGSFFVWDFDVTGNETVTDEQILRALEAYGIGIGTPGLSIDQEDLRNHVLLELPDVSWLAVNVRGCTAHVQVVERVRSPAIVDRDTAANVIAVKDGLVTKVEALDGQAQVLVGGTVTKGQLLISGVVDSTRQVYRLLHGMGSVWARTWYELSVRVPLEVTEKREAAQKTTAISLDFGKNRFKIYTKGSMLDSGCDKIIKYNQLTLPGGCALPVTLVRETTVRYETETVTRTREEAEAEGEALLQDYLLSRLSEGGSVSNTRFASAQQGKYLLCTLTAECQEQIGRQVLLPEE